MKLLEKARSWAQDLASRLEARGIRVDEIILFGSVARGDYAATSDLDLIVVSKDWEGVEYTERLGLLYKMWDKPIDANFLALTPRELAEGAERSVVLRDASRYWRVLYRRGSES